MILYFVSEEDSEPFLHETPMGHYTRHDLFLVNDIRQWLVILEKLKLIQVRYPEWLALLLFFCMINFFLSILQFICMVNSRYGCVPLPDSIETTWKEACISCNLILLQEEKKRIWVQDKTMLKTKHVSHLFTTEYFIITYVSQDR